MYEHAVICRSEASVSIGSRARLRPCFEMLHAVAALLAMTAVSGEGVIQMQIITLDSETDFEGWRKAARALA